MTDFVGDGRADTSVNSRTWSNQKGKLNKKKSFKQEIPVVDPDPPNLRELFAVQFQDGGWEY